MFIFTLTCLMKLNGGILCELIRCLRLCCCCHAKNKQRNAEKCRPQMQLTSFTALRLFSVVAAVVVDIFYYELL